MGVASGALGRLRRLGRLGLLDVNREPEMGVPACAGRVDATSISTGKAADQTSWTRNCKPLDQLLSSDSSPPHIQQKSKNLHPPPPCYPLSVIRYPLSKTRLAILYCIALRGWDLPRRRTSGRTGADEHPSGDPDRIIVIISLSRGGRRQLTLTDVRRGGCYLQLTVRTLPCTALSLLQE